MGSFRKITDGCTANRLCISTSATALLAVVAGCRCLRGGDGGCGDAGVHGAVGVVLLFWVMVAGGGWAVPGVMGASTWGWVAGVAG